MNAGGVLVSLRQTALDIINNINYIFIKISLFMSTYLINRLLKIFNTQCITLSYDVKT